MGLLRLFHVCYDRADGGMNCETITDYILECLEDIASWIFLFSLIANIDYNGGRKTVLLVEGAIKGIDVVLDLIGVWRRYCKCRRKYGTKKGPCCIRKEPSDRIEGAELQFKVGRGFLKFTMLEIPLIITAMWANLVEQNLSDEPQTKITAEDAASID